MLCPGACDIPRPSVMHWSHATMPWGFIKGSPPRLCLASPRQRKRRGSAVCSRVCAPCYDVLRESQPLWRGTCSLIGRHAGLCHSNEPRSHARWCWEARAERCAPQQRPCQPPSYRQGKCLKSGAPRSHARRRRDAGAERRALRGSLGQVLAGPEEAVQARALELLRPARQARGHVLGHHQVRPLDQAAPARTP